MSTGTPSRAIGELALALHTAPRRFALLLGSGVSVGSGIPTGWDVVKDIAGKLAVATGAGEVADPLAWYADEYDEDPDYSRLLERIAPGPDQRRDLLADYFEPTDEDRTANRKVPTRAHTAIAKLVARDAVRVIVTTNFDRLLEQALSAVGVEPVVVSTAAAAAGATPLVHARCVVIKVHGDYLDPNIRNTVGELDSYEPAVDALLDRVFDEYGLIVCGWSARWDTALRRAIQRSKSRRYATYWAAVGPLAAEATDLVALRGGQVLPIDGADEFFERIVDRLGSLDDLSSRGQLGVEAAVAETKRLLTDPVHRIRLHDLVLGQVERVRSLITYDGSGRAGDEYLTVVSEIDREAAELVAVLATVAYFATDNEQVDLLVRSVRQLVAPTEVTMGGYTAWINLRGYPALLALYAIGLGAGAAGRWSTIARVLDQKVLDPSVSATPTTPLAGRLRPFAVLDNGAIRGLLATPRATPISEHLAQAALAHLRAVLRMGQAEFDDLFDQWEYLLGVVCTLLNRHAYVGRFGWRNQFAFDFVPPSAMVDSARSSLEAQLAVDAIAMDTALQSFNAYAARAAAQLGFG